MLMANSITGAFRALTWPMNRQIDHRIWTQNRLLVDNRGRAKIKTDIDDQVGHQWFIAHWETIAIQLISTKSICRRWPKASRIASG
jgi:hypothetical protein